MVFILSTHKCVYIFTYLYKKRVDFQINFIFLSAYPESEVDNTYLEHAINFVSTSKVRP